jgi:hypothetical protein
MKLICEYVAKKYIIVSEFKIDTIFVTVLLSLIQKGGGKWPDDALATVLLLKKR